MTSLKIDKFNLDEEVMQQAEKFDAVGQDWADAVAERDRLKIEIETVDAVLDEKLRNTLEKVTDKAVQAATLRHPDHIDATRNYLLAKARADKLGVRKQSFEQRKDMLEKLAQLFLSGYYIQPSIRKAS